MTDVSTRNQADCKGADTARPEWVDLFSALTQAIDRALTSTEDPRP